MIEPEQSQFTTPDGRLLEYDIKGLKIIHTFDYPHLIKTVRNNLRMKDLKHLVMLDKDKYRKNLEIEWDQNNKKKLSASWTDIEAFYIFDRDGMYGLAPKITDEHIKPEKRKMKVKLATQVLSKTMGRNIFYCNEQKLLPNNCLGTSTVLLFFNDLFDSLNGGGAVVNDTLVGSINKDSKHFKFWEYALKMLEKMKFGPNRKTGKPSQSNVMKHFMSTLKGLKKLCDHLFENEFSSVSLRQTNQDGLENFFGLIKSYCYSPKAPTPRQFRCAYATAIVNNLTSHQSLNANCEDDGSKPLLSNVYDIFTITSDKAARPDQAKTEWLSDFNNLNLVEIPSTVNDVKNHIQGLVCKKLLSKIKCIPCHNTVKSKKEIEKEPESMNIFEAQIAAIKLSLHPRVEFINAVKDLITNIEIAICEHCFRTNIKKTIIKGNNFLNCFISRLLKLQ